MGCVTSIKRLDFGGCYGGGKLKISPGLMAPCGNVY